MRIWTLNKERPLPITEQQVSEIGQTHIGPIVRGFTKALNEWGDYFGINTELRVEHFIGQCAEECGFVTMREYGAESYFKKYNGRKDLGNTQPGDGPRFKGRGAIQLTGRAWYTKFTAAMGKLLGADFVKNPEKLEDPYYGTLASLWYWQQAGVNKFADKDDLRGETRRINGGYTNYNKRVYFVGRAKAIIKGADIPAHFDHDVPPLPNAIEPPAASSKPSNTVTDTVASGGLAGTAAAAGAHAAGLPFGWVIVAGIAVAVVIGLFVASRKGK